MPAPSHEARSVPPGFHVVSGTGYSLVLPEAWKPLETRGDLAFGSFSGDDMGMNLQAAPVDPKEAISDVAAEATKGVLTNGHATLTRHSTMTVNGRDVLINEFELREDGPMLRGSIRVQTSDDGVIAVVCHAAASVWENIRSGCDPIFATIRVGAAAKTGASQAPPSMRWLEGTGWRVAVPSTWVDTAGSRDTTLAIARSGDNAQSMLVVTVIGEATSERPTEKNRDAILARYADAMTHREDQTTRVTRAARNVVDLEFSRETAKQRGGLFNAFYDLGRTKLFVTCGGLGEAYAKHANICDVAIRSVRSEPAR